MAEPIDLDSLDVHQCLEICIRKNVVLPEAGNREHKRWKKEGPVPYDQLDTVRNG